MFHRLAEYCFDFGKLLIEYVLCFCFDIQSQKRFGIACPAVEPPVLKLNCYAVKVVGLALTEFFAQFLHHRVFVFDGKIDFAAGEVPLQRFDKFAHRLRRSAQNVY